MDLVLFLAFWANGPAAFKSLRCNPRESASAAIAFCMPLQCSPTKALPPPPQQPPPPLSSLHLSSSAPPFSAAISPFLPHPWQRPCLPLLSVQPHSRNELRAHARLRRAACTQGGRESRRRGPQCASPPRFYGTHLVIKKVLRGSTLAERRFAAACKNQPERPAAVGPKGGG